MTETQKTPETVTDRAIRYARALFAGNAGGHGADHALRVYRLALHIARQEGNCDMEVVALAALLHDADDPKLFQTRDNENARRFLREMGVGEEKTEKICRIINGVSFSRNRGRRPDTPEGRAVQDADRLDAMGAVGVARTFAYGGEHGRSLTDSVRHFYDKLLLLQEELNTPAAREMARERHEFLLSFLREWDRETGET